MDRRGTSSPQDIHSSCCVLWRAGALGENEAVKLDPFQEAAVSNEGDGGYSAAGHPLEAVLGGVQQLGKRIASMIFD
jgi:hypothetical protein